jgi:hypothetical protein
VNEKVSDERLLELIDIEEGHERTLSYMQQGSMAHAAAYDRAASLRELRDLRGRYAVPEGYRLVPQSTINDLLSVDPKKCPARIREALYELVSLAAAPQQEGTTRMREKILRVLAGIDKTELESPDGWWETSAGADFGKAKLEELLAAAPQASS